MIFLDLRFDVLMTRSFRGRGQRPGEDILQSNLRSKKIKALFQEQLVQLKFGDNLIQLNVFLLNFFHLAQSGLTHTAVLFAPRVVGRIAHVGCSASRRHIRARSQALFYLSQQI